MDDPTNTAPAVPETEPETAGPATADDIDEDPKGDVKVTSTDELLAAEDAERGETPPEEPPASTDPQPAPTPEAANMGPMEPPKPDEVRLFKPPPPKQDDDDDDPLPPPRMQASDMGKLHRCGVPIVFIERKANMSRYLLNWSVDATIRNNLQIRDEERERYLEYRQAARVHSSDLNFFVAALRLVRDNRVFGGPARPDLNAL